MNVSPRDRAHFARYGIAATAPDEAPADPAVRMHTERLSARQAPPKGASLIARIKSLAGLKPDGR